MKEGEIERGSKGYRIKEEDERLEWKGRIREWKERKNGGDEKGEGEKEKEKRRKEIKQGKEGDGENE